MKTKHTSRPTLALLAAGLATWLGANAAAQAGIAYGTINNFDTVNDTSNTCHGFEIELDDCRSQDITYCYSYNHYGTPNIREDSVSVPGDHFTAIPQETARSLAFFARLADRPGG